MAYLITHFYENGTEDQYNAVRDVVHPASGLPEGQTYHAAGPTDGGFLVVAVWTSKDANDRFINNVLMPALPKVSGGFTNPPQQRTAELVNLQTG